MTLHLKLPSQNNNLSPRILVIGIGGTGGNIINSMINSGIEGVDFLNVNTDSQQLKHSKVEKTLQLGPSCTQGLGAGGDPEMGKKAAEEVLEEIEQYIENSNMVFLTAGMGGGTGTGAAPVIAKITKEHGILTVGVVTKPFQMEGKRKIEKAEKGVIELQKYVDNLIVIPNQNIFALAKPDTPVTDSLQLANNVLIDGVKSIIDLMVKPGIMNHDFADVRTVMSETGKVHLGTGVAEGEDRVNEATDKAISNPLLENNSMSGAKGVLINITCGDDTSLHDIDLAINKISEESNEDANIIWGLQKDNNYNGKFKISVISTGIDSENYYKDIIHKENLTKLDNITNSKIISENNQNFNQEKHPEKNKPKKKTLLGMIFGTNSRDVEKISTKSDPEKESSKEQFIKEFKEITDEKNAEIEKDNEKIVIEDESVRYMPEVDNTSGEQNTENLVGQNDVNDDLLQIPAFLRRQAN